MNKKIKKFDNTIFDSTEEYYFNSYLTELFDAGFIDDYKAHPFSINLTEGLVNRYEEQKSLKTKIKSLFKSQIILRPSVYTPDFNIIWNSKAEGLFYTLLNNHQKIDTPFIASMENNKLCSIVETKPKFDRNNMTRLFVNNQKFIWDKYNKYINLIHITDLFEKTFTPREYLITPTGKQRVLKYIPQTLNQFINDR